MQYGGHSSNPPIALTPSARRLYSRKSSLTSDTLRSSSEHSRNRLFGGASLIPMGEWGRDEIGVSNRLDVSGAGRSDDRREADGDP